MRRLLAITFLALVAAAPSLPGLGGGDGRVVVDAAAMPWRALARLQIPGEGRCTAVLVAPRTALTAAHCLRGRRLGHDVPPGAVHLLTGYAAGRFARHSLATGWQRAPDGSDVAVVTLADPIGIDVLPLAAADPRAGATVALGGYNQDRAEVIDADLSCRVLAALPGRLVHSCAGTFGTSGAPLLARGDDGTWTIVGLQVAAFTDRIGGIAVPASVLRQALPAAPE
jgi:protease YdgD